MKKYYNLIPNEKTTDLYIYGDITSWPWMESDVSAYNIVQELDAVEAEHINVYINSYGGEVAEGLAIHSALKRHPAKVTTYCDGFACSAASIVFMAGDERVMGEASLLMIHNAWTYTAGDASALRKEADDLDKISDAAANAYRAAVSIDNATLSQMLEEETWITPVEALEMGFATAIVALTPVSAASMSARRAVYARLAPSIPKAPAPSAPKQTTKKLFNFGGKA